MNNFIDAALKGWVTSVLGLGLMVYSIYRWDQGELTDWQAGAIFIGGLTLIFVKDKIPTYIGNFFTAVMEKFTGKKP